MDLVKPIEKKFYCYLDTYRFIAVLIVILSHWLPSYFKNYQLAKIGVDMFFVLSGFLITENLLNQKANVIIKKIGIGTAFTTFYIRRSLRIFPIYYLVIFAMFFLPVADFAGKTIWYILYCVNYLIIKQHQWPGMFSHLWSLAVEEQFYLIWPAVILFIPYKYISPTLIILIAFSALFIAISFPTNSFSILSLQACISTLCTGALLALMKHSGNTLFHATKYDGALFLFLIILLCIAIFRGIPQWGFQFITALFSFFFIKILITKKKPLLDLVFGNPYTSFLGKISYGLYLYHNFIPWILRNLNGTETLQSLGHIKILPEIGGGYAIFIQHWILLLIIAISSWAFIEKPLINLKKRFAY